MKDIKEYIYEGLLKGQDAHLAAGDTDLKDAYNLACL